MRKRSVAGVRRKGDEGFGVGELGGRIDKEEG